MCARSIALLTFLNFSMKTTSALLSLSLSFASLSSSFADEVITIDGSKLVGVISSIADGNLTLSTQFAGDLVIPMDQVDTFKSDDPLTVRLESGETLTGTATLSDDDTVKVEGSAGNIQGNKEDIRLTWLPGVEDPEIAAMRRNWSFRAAVDIAGSSGNTDKASARLKLEAELEGPNDRLRFFAQHESGESDGETNARETKVGSRYTNFMSDRWGWFTRVTFENDKFEDLDLRTLATAGISYRIFDKPTHYLVSSAGLAHQYSDFANGTSEEVVGLDFGLSHHYEFSTFLITETEISYLPSIEDPEEFRLEHSSWVQVPISGGGRWNIRAGVENTYVSDPEPGIEELDTLFYSSLVFSWD